MPHKKIKKFYEVDGVDYGFQRWHRNPVAQFDYACTRQAIQQFLMKEHFRHVLQVGCGPGTWTPFLAQRADRVTAVDLSQTMLAHARKTVKDKNVRFINADIMEFKNEEKFDCIFSVRMIEYIQDKKQFFQKCHDMLISGGKTCIVTKTKHSYWYGKSRIRKALKKCAPFLFAYENRMLNQEKKENRPNFWQKRLPARTFVAMQRASGFHRFTVKPLIIRPPIFMRGKSEIPLVPPLFEKPLLVFFRILNRALGDHPFFTFLAESYMVVSEKR